MNHRDFQHYSAEPLKNVSSVPLASQRQYPKPNGLWISDDNSNLGWAEWCRSERFRLDRLEHKAVIKVDMDQVLHISGSLELEDFNKKYRVVHDYGTTLQIAAMDWPRVAQDHRGVIITPYLWDMRLDGPSWYYGWDCASGCIWDARAIVSVSQ